MEAPAGVEDTDGFEERNERLIAFWQRRGFVSRGSRILDVGAGTGHLGRSLRARLPQASITCIERGEELAARLRDDGFEVLSDLADLPTGSAFDAVLLIEVIEHVPDPVAFLRRLAAHLAPGAHLFLTTPCGELRTGSRKTNAYETPEHVHFFTQRSLTQAIRRAGLGAFQCERIDALYPRAHAAGPIARAKRWSRRALAPLIERFEGPRHLTGFAAAAPRR